MTKVRSSQEVEETIVFRAEEGDGGQSGQPIRVLVNSSGLVFDREIVVLELKRPTCKPAIRVFHLLQPLERRVIRDDSKMSSVEEGAKLLNCEQDGETFSFGDAIIALGLR